MSGSDWRELLFARRTMGVRLGLGAVRAVDAAMGHPAADVPVVHVVGTNGKGSTAAMVELGLRRLGRRTGTFTSPHLQRVGERVRIDGVAVADDDIERAAAQVLAGEASAGVRLSFFEVLTLAALSLFAEQALDVLVLEAGMGGRLDSTRVRRPWHTLIAKIARDHERFLGPRLCDIAAEKAAVLQNGVPAASVTQGAEVSPVLRAYARRSGATLTFVRPTSRAPRGLDGDHQRHNAALALHALRRLEPAADLTLVDGVRWAGRLERFDRGQGTVVLDAAHNPDAMEALAQALRDHPPDLVVFGAAADKDAGAMWSSLPPQARRWWVHLDPPPLRASAGHQPFSEAAERSFELDEPALSAGVVAAAEAGATVLVCGSHRLVGVVRQALCPAEGHRADDLALSDPRAPAGSDAHLEPPRGAS